MFGFPWGEIDTWGSSEVKLGTENNIPDKDLELIVFNAVALPS